MLFEEKRTSSEVENPETVSGWPENYFTEPEPARRKAILEQQSADDGDSDQLERLNRLFEIRYKLDKKGNYADQFMRSWMELKMIAENMDSYFGARKNKKKVLAALNDLCLNRDEEFSREILYQEMCHLTALYISACANDSNYGSVIWGIGKISDEKLRGKICLDLEQIGKGIPEHLDLEEEFRILKPAILDMEEQMLKSR